MFLFKSCSCLASPANIFLVDSLGACLSTCVLIAIIAPFEPFFRMPVPILYILAAIAASYALYALCCYLARPHNWSRYLRILVGANLLYAGLTASLVLYYYHRITIWCLLYFSLELVVISGLILLERRLLVATIQGGRH